MGVENCFQKAVDYRYLCGIKCLKNTSLTCKCFLLLVVVPEIGMRLINDEDQNMPVEEALLVMRETSEIGILVNDTDNYDIDDE